MLVAVGLLRASGAFGFLQQAVDAAAVGLGADMRFTSSVGQAVMKAFSGSASRGLMLDTFKADGVDSFEAHLAALVQGSSDTTFYVLAVCAGAARLETLGHAVAGAVVADVAAFAASVGLAYLMFG